MNMQTVRFRPDTMTGPPVTAAHAIRLSVAVQYLVTMGPMTISRLLVRFGVEFIILGKFWTWLSVPF